MTEREPNDPEDLTEANLVFLAEQEAITAVRTYSGRVDIKVNSKDEALINVLVHSLRIASQRIHGDRFYEPKLAETIYYRRQCQDGGFEYEDRPAHRNLALGYDPTNEVVYLENRNEFDQGDFKDFRTEPSKVFMKALQSVDLQTQLEQAHSLLES